MSCTPGRGTYNQVVKAHWLNRATILLSFVGLVLTGMLLAVHYGGQAPMCGEGGGCSAVALHPSSILFGVPVAAVGLFVYVVHLGLALGRAFGPHDVWTAASRLGLAISGLSLLGVAYYLYMMFGVIGEACPLCLASHGVMLALFAVHAMMFRLMPVPTEHRADGVITSVGVVLSLAALMPSCTGGSASTALPGADLDKAKIVPAEYKTKGSPDAKITVVEFADFVCPACRQGTGPIRQALEPYGDKIRFGFRHLPLHQIQGHEMSVPLAVASELAAEKGKFWEFFYEVMDGKNDEIAKTEEGMYAIFEDVGLDPKDLKARIDTDEKLIEAVTSDVEVAASLEINGTPTFIVFAEGQGAKRMNSQQLMEFLGSKEAKQLAGVQ